MDVDAGSPTGAPLSQGTKRPLPDDSGEQSQGASLAPVSRVSRGESEEVVDGVGQDAVVGELFHRERPRGIDKRGLPFEHLGPMELVVNEARGTFDVWAVEYHGRRRRYLFGKQTREEAVGAMEVFEREYTSRIFQKGEWVYGCVWVCLVCVFHFQRPWLMRHLHSPSRPPTALTAPHTHSPLPSPPPNPPRRPLRRPALECVQQANPPPLGAQRQGA